MMHFLTLGILLGLSAGIAPGPLLTLVITETLQHGIRSGVKVALAPIITDLPIILIAFFVLAGLSGFHNVLGLISLAGGCFILYMGYDSMRARGLEPGIQQSEPKSFTKGILANALNPHPYLFWFSVGAPVMTRAMSVNRMAPLVFLGGFYAFLLGSKILLVLLVGRSRSFLSGRGYICTLRFLGGVLCLLALVLFRDGLRLLGVM